jgi:hypothetical protein
MKLRSYKNNTEGTISLVEQDQSLNMSRQLLLEHINIRIREKAFREKGGYSGA